VNRPPPLQANGYNLGMDEAADCINDPEAFARANEKLRLDYLRSLTVESATQALEDLLSTWAVLREESSNQLEASPRRPPPPGPWLSIILEGKPAPDD